MSLETWAGFSQTKGTACRLWAMHPLCGGVLTSTEGVKWHSSTHKQSTNLISNSENSFFSKTNPENTVALSPLHWDALLNQDCNYLSWVTMVLGGFHARDHLNPNIGWHRFSFNLQRLTFTCPRVPPIHSFWKFQNLTDLWPNLAFMLSKIKVNCDFNLH